MRRAFASPKIFFSPTEIEQIEAAISSAEQLTSGEIRVHITNKIPDNLEPIEHAQLIFEKLNMTKTALRNGVLFYIAPYEKAFCILGDTGIYHIAPKDLWTDIERCMRSYFKHSDFCIGLCEGIVMAGKALQVYFPYDSKTDANELSNAVSNS